MRGVAEEACTVQPGRPDHRSATRQLTFGDALGGRVAVWTFGVGGT